MADAAVSAGDWIKGIALSVLASVIGGASKLAIRKSWLMVENLTESSQQSPPGIELPDHQKQQDEDLVVTSPSSDEIDDDGIIDGTCGGFGGCDGCEITEHIGDIDGTLGGCAVTEHWTCGPDLSFTDEDETQTQQLERGVTKTRRLALCLRVSGMVGMTLLNPLCCVLAMEYASPSILAPFSGLTLVWIISFSEALIGEKPMAVQIAAAGLIICGETIVAVFGDHTNPDKSIEDVRASYLDPSFLVYLVCMALWMAALGCAIVSSHFSDTTFRRFAWGVSGGSITGLQNFLKDSLTIIKAVGAGGQYPWFFPILAAMAAATSLIGLLFLTACMKQYDATFSSAMFVGSFVISASIMSTIHYSTFQDLNGIINYIMYPFGLMVLLAGVAILLRSSTVTGGEDILNADGEVCDYSGALLECNESDGSSGGRENMQRPLVSSGSQVGELT